MTITMFGIPNCDTVKKARTWLAGHEIHYDFHDYKKMGVDQKTLQSWVATLGWEALLNRAGTTFRNLPDDDKSDLNADCAIAIMLAHPSTIKRPVVEAGDVLLVGFKPDKWAQHFAA